MKDTETADPAPRVSDERLADIQHRAEVWTRDYLPGSQKNAIGQDLLALLARNAELEALARNVAATEPKKTGLMCNGSLFATAIEWPEMEALRARAVELTGGGA